ncbi:hypothetical protein [Sphingobacterium faecium]|uniref:hypothetical protein n=1 Tax=Sphingobacterium faecium TaxID=34087 RepID=UPI002468641F|nr:hypothetical protein [Sphingobacterium faecium]MDH5826825.1 hypothetical protein [Sphingobacterium faecium]
MKTIMTVPPELVWNRTLVSHTSGTCTSVNFVLAARNRDSSLLMDEKLDHIVRLLEGEKDALLGWMSSKDCCDYVAISDRTLYRKIKEGWITVAYLENKQRYFRKQDVLNLYIRYHQKTPKHMP